MRSIPLLWSWQELQSMYVRSEKFSEERGTSKNWISFVLDILEDDTQNGKRYLNISVAVNDVRSGKGLGSAYQPFCNNFIYYADGEIDMEKL